MRTFPDPTFGKVEGKARRITHKLARRRVKLPRNSTKTIFPRFAPHSHASLAHRTALFRRFSHLLALRHGSILILHYITPPPISSVVIPQAGTHHESSGPLIGCQVALSDYQPITGNALFRSLGFDVHTGCNCASRWVELSFARRKRSLKLLTGHP